ncbi:MAG: dTMP kinase [Firmicutes bacterium]|nr:dTMP kinase [Bacillota bacterium]
MKKGIFITFEGTDGSGKSTQIERFADYISSRGFDMLLTREPGGTDVSEKIRNIILDPENTEESPVTEALLYAASRAQLVSEKIKPALEKGCVVICDRFVDSSIAYQAYARGLGDDVMKINEFAVQGVMPDITFFLDIDPESARERRNIRGTSDRLENEGLAFQIKVYEGYKKLIESCPERFRVIDTKKSPDEVYADIIKAFTEYERRA